MRHMFGDPALYHDLGAGGSAALATSWHPARYMRCAMSAAQLGADQACVEPCRRMQVGQSGVRRGMGRAASMTERCQGPSARLQARAQLMWSSRAYTHQYQAFGLSAADFEGCFAHVQDLLDRYAAL